MIQSLLFFPEKNYDIRPDQLGLSYETVLLSINSKVRLLNWYFPAKENRGTFLFFHGNAGNISGRIYKAQGWVLRGYNVLLMEYRGYGQSTGTLESDEDTVEDARAGFRWLREEKNMRASDIILYGESLGCFPAVRLASESPFRAVILEAPYTSFADLAPVHYPMIPAWIRQPLLSKFRFSVADAIPKIRIPLFVLHGTEDETCPYFMSQELFKIAASTEKKFWSIPKGMHNNLPEIAGEAYWDEPASFVETLPSK